MRADMDREILTDPWKSPRYIFGNISLASSECPTSSKASVPSRPTRQHYPFLDRFIILHIHNPSTSTPYIPHCFDFHGDGEKSDRG
jgi:hypothetical protein